MSKGSFQTGAAQNGDPQQITVQVDIYDLIEITSGFADQEGVAEEWGLFLAWLQDGYNSVQEKDFIDAGPVLAALNHIKNATINAVGSDSKTVAISVADLRTILEAQQFFNIAQTGLQNQDITAAITAADLKNVANEPDIELMVKGTGQTVVFSTEPSVEAVVDPDALGGVFDFGPTDYPVEGPDIIYGPDGERIFIPPASTTDMDETSTAILQELFGNNPEDARMVPSAHSPEIVRDAVDHGIKQLYLIIEKAQVITKSLSPESPSDPLTSEAGPRRPSPLEFDW
ncbi:MAG: hypothetical protein AAF569_03715 [Pseudomonadota bacterium]